MRIKLVLVLVTVALLMSMADARRRKNRNRQRNKDMKCKYGRPITKGECVNGTMTKTFSLKRQNSYNNCTDTKSLTRPCRMKLRCKYRVSKGDCDPATQKRTKTYILKDGSDTNCNPTFTKEKPCRVKPQKVKDDCKYTLTQNSVCDDDKKIEMTLKRGSDTCAQKKKFDCDDKRVRKIQKKMKKKMNKKERKRNRKERRQNRAKGRHMMNENE